MDQNQEVKSTSVSLFEAWMKWATGFWGSMSRMSPGATGPSETPTSSKTVDKGRVQESMESTLKMWQTLSAIMSEPGAMGPLFQGINALPEILSKMTQTAWNGYFQMQQQWLERAGRIGHKTEAYKFEDLDQTTFRAWTEIYEEELRRFLNIPQLGLTRFYQERIGRFADKFNLFQGAMAEFLYLLYLPMEKSFKVMQEKLEALTEEGKLPETSQDYYRMSLKILEGHYMTLFKSPEYTQVLGKTLDAMEEFAVARQEILQDIMQSLPVATNKEMDDLYKELYELKKRVRQLEKDRSIT